VTAVDPAAGFSAVMARIAEIQRGFAPVSSPASPASSASGSDFASVLAGVQGGQATAGASAATGALTASVMPGGSARQQQVVDVAKQYLGVPYVYGGTDPSHGLDCSGFVQLVYRRLGIELPRVTYDQVKVGQPVDRADLQPGDLVFKVGDGNRVNGHVGIYIGGGQWINAPHTGDVVKIAPLPTNITAIRRIIPNGGS
jgi:cell wall-associated NlpC family hydrolase